MSSPSRPNAAEVGPKARFQAAPASPNPAAVSSIERRIVAALPSSKGCERSISGQAHSRPCRSSASGSRAGEPIASACTAEHSSWSRPGRVSSLVRVPPPISSAASITVTPTPRVASVAAQARPFGPAPTTTASLMPVWAGNGFPSSQGWRPTMSATSTVPSSIRPSAASWIR